MSTKTQNNGTATADKKEAATIAKPVSQAQTNPIKVEAIPTVKLATVEHQLQKLEQLTNLNEKREKLLETQGNLQKFKVASDEQTNLLELSDRRGSTFKTHNPTVIGAIIEMLKKDIELKMSSVDAEIIALA